jgi:PAS domain S-box-containing protein
MHISQKDKRLEPLVELLVKYTSLDFSEKAVISDKGDEIDAISTGLNVVAEELQWSLAKEKQQAQELKQLNNELERKIEERSFELIKSEKRFRALIENSSDLVSLLDKDLNPIYRSPSSTRVLGWTDKERENSGGIDLTHPDDKEQINSWIIEVLNNPGEPIPVYFRTRHKDGYYICLEGVITNMLHDESLKAIVTNFKDVTEKKQAEEKLGISLSRSKHAQEIASVGHWELDFRTYKSSWSDEAFRIYGVEPGTTEGSYEFFLKHVHPDDLEKVKAITGAAMQNFKSFSFTHRIIRGDGEIRYIKASGEFELDKNNKPISLFGVAMDITQLKEKEAKLKQVNHELETFIYKSSHDLRGPIASILGLINVAGFDIKDEKPMMYLKNIGALAEKLDKSLIELVKIMSVKDKTLALKPVNLEEMISEILNSLNYIEGFDKIKFTINNTITRPVITDASFLNSILLNLIENAIKYRKYSNPKSTIIITLQIKKDNKLLVEVADNGIGIKDEIKEKIFDMFYRGTDQAKGSGLGLYLVKKTAEKLGGNIEVISGEKPGSVFSVTIPIG